MAECQDLFTYDPSFNTLLESNLSEPRLAPYIKAANGDRSYATKLYLWNARLAKAFLFPLQIAEIVTRNSINKAFAAEFKDPDWVKSPPFTLTPPSTVSYQASRGRLSRQKSGPHSADDIVASLTLDFWSNLFRAEYDSLWSSPGLLKSVFPLMPSGFDRTQIQVRVARINWLRNRIAHHETIHAKINSVVYLDHIDEFLGFICDDTRRWVKANATVKAVFNAPPTAISDFSGTPLSLSNYRSPPRFSGGETLLEAMRKLMAVRPSVGLVDDSAGDAPYRLVTNEMIMLFIEKVASHADGYVALQDNTVRAVIDTFPSPDFALISIDCTTGDARNLFFPKGKTKQRPQALIVIDQSKTPKEIGILMKPAIKY